jgi:hypothetical protein
MKSDEDPVVAEIRETRQRLFKQCHNNPYEYGKYIRSWSKAHHKQVSSRAPKAA